MHPWHNVDMPQYLFSLEAITAIIEIPKGSKNKYELDKATGLLKLDRVLYSAVHYPANYGFIPRTIAGDGDPLDILVICQTAIDPLVIVKALPLGLIKMVDDKGVDDKIIAVCVDDPGYSCYTTIESLPTHLLKEIERFFMDYKQLEHKEVLVDGFLGADEARYVVNDALKSYALAYPFNIPR